MDPFGTEDLRGESLIKDVGQIKPVDIRERVEVSGDWDRGFRLRAGGELCQQFAGQRLTAVEYNFVSVQRRQSPIAFKIVLIKSLQLCVTGLNDIAAQHMAHFLGKDVVNPASSSGPFSVLPEPESAPRQKRR